VAITIDPANKRLILDSTSVTAQAIYKAWVDWLVLSDNSKYLPAFRSAGGDDLGGGLLIPAYYFLSNGWRVRPMEANQNLTITGNLFVDGGGVPVVSTLGTFQVNVNYTVPVQAQGISTSGSSGPTASEISAAVGAQVVEGTFTRDQILRIMAAALAGTSNKAGNTITFKGIDGTTDRIAGSFDAENNRTGATLNGS
jgi:hypothetical protein